MSEFFGEGPQDCVICGEKVLSGSVSKRDLSTGRVYAHSKCSNPDPTRAIRSCVTCGYRRKVKIWFEWRGKSTLAEYHALNCTACALVSKSNDYRERAEAFRLKAKAIREKRKERGLEGAEP